MKNTLKITHCYRYYYRQSFFGPSKTLRKRNKPFSFLRVLRLMVSAARCDTVNFIKTINDRVQKSEIQFMISLLPF